MKQQVRPPGITQRSGATKEAVAANARQLQNEIHDLEIALHSANVRGDQLQEKLHRLTASLTGEIRDRQAAEAKLQELVQAITREKGDLEILVQILRDQGDISAEDSKKARVDCLMQIANRRGFDEYLRKEWRRHVGTQQPLSLLFCDVDHFKLYNDHFGHLAGDECLKAVAGAMSGCFRRGDLLARYGGEEFAVVLPRTRLEGALQVAERVRATVSAAGLAHPVSPLSDQITVSIGVASTVPQPEDPADGSGLVEEADRNLYRAKHAGRNRVGHPAMDQLNHDD